MKIEKLVSFTVLNSFVLLIFGAVIASCQKNEFHKTGLLTKWQTPGRSIASAGRSIASAKANLEYDQFSLYQDPKQVYLYCKLNSSRPSSCYKHEISKVLSGFAKLNTNSINSNLVALKEKYKYENISAQFNNIINSIDKKLMPKMIELTHYREAFCLKNSTQFVDKCLTQYIDKDTFTVLNKFHHKNKMNGHEYLYFKSHIKKQLSIKLQEAKFNITKKNHII